MESKATAVVTPVLELLCTLPVVAASSTALSRRSASWKPSAHCALLNSVVKIITIHLEQCLETFSSARFVIHNEYFLFRFHRLFLIEFLALRSFSA